MKYIILLFLLPFVANGQDLTKVKAITFKYSVGHYNFGDTGRYETEEITEFLPVSKHKFARQVYTITKRYVTNPGTNENTLSINDTTWSISNKNFDRSIFQVLVDNCNRNQSDFNKETILPTLSKITKSEIISVAQNNDQAFWFIDEETNKIDEFGRDRIKKIKGLHLVDSFLLKQKPSLEYEMVVIDAWNNLTITFIEQLDTTTYKFQFYELLGQPFSKVVNNNYSDRQRFINIQVNRILTQLVLHNSLTEKAIGLDSLKEKYITWYINNKMWSKNGRQQ